MADVDDYVTSGSASVAEWSACQAPGSFDFYFYGVAVGLVCLFGFVVNTLGLMVVHRHRQRLLTCVTVDRLTADFDRLLQSTIVADISLIWMTFISRVVPTTLKYVSPLLSPCVVYPPWLTSAIERPLATLTQIAVVWLSTATIASGHSLAERGRSNNLRRMSLGGVSFKPPHSRVKVVVAIIALSAIVFASPMTFDTAVSVTSHIGGHFANASSTVGPPTSEPDVTTVVPLADNGWYRVIYLDGLSTAVLALPLLYAVWVVVSELCCGRRRHSSRWTGRADESDLGGLGSSTWAWRRKDSMMPAAEVQLRDVERITTYVAVWIVLAFVPQVALRIIGWFHVTEPQPEVDGLQPQPSTTVALEAASVLAAALNCSLKTVGVCLLGLQYGDCAQSLCSPTDVDDDDLEPLRMGPRCRRGGPRSTQRHPRASVDDATSESAWTDGSMAYGCDPSTRSTIASLTSSTSAFLLQDGCRRDVMARDVTAGDTYALSCRNVLHA